jgi:hypothetical protein
MVETKVSRKQSLSFECIIPGNTLRTEVKLVIPLSVYEPGTYRNNIRWSTLKVHVLRF